MVGGAYIVKSSCHTECCSYDQSYAKKPKKLKPQSCWFGIGGIVNRDLIFTHLSSKLHPEKYQGTSTNENYCYKDKTNRVIGIYVQRCGRNENCHKRYTDKVHSNREGGDASVVDAKALICPHSISSCEWDYE